MPDNFESALLLVNLAAEGIADLIPGCALTINSSRSGKAGLVDVAPPKAINLFGARIVERWLQGLESRSKPEHLEMVAQLATLPVAECRRQAAAAIERVARSASTDDKALAAEYITVIPLSVRRALVHNAETGRMALPTVFMHENGVGLIRLLPTDVPPFPVGSDLPGTTYVLDELLGLGGFGAVYKAKNRCEQHQPPRAIKFCLDPSMVASLRREREILDRLMAVDNTKWSTRIVRLYGYALDAKPPFLVYEYVSGGDLTSNIRVAREKTGRGFRPALALELIRQVVEALSFAHGQGLVHRDLKPANVLVSGSKIKLTDFGIGGVVASHVARNGVSGSLSGHLTAADQATLFRGSGTPLYMSPEQRRGDHPDPRHDLYSLGVMWYQLIVGDVSKELHPGWQDELIEEYQTSKETIDLIARCVGYFKKRPLNGGELLALLPPPASNATMAAAVPAPGAALATPSFPAVAPPPPAPPAPANGEADELDRLKALLADQIDRDALPQALATVGAVLRLDPADEEALEARNIIEERLRGGLQEVHAFREHRGWVRALAVAPDGLTALSASDDQMVFLWDLTELRPLRALRGHGAAVSSVAFAADGQRAVSGSWDATARVWDVASGQELQRFTGPWKLVKAVAFAPDGTRVLLGTDDNCLHLFDVASGTEIATLVGHTDLIQSVAISADGRRALSGSDDGTMRGWDLASSRELRCFSGHGDSVSCVGFAPNAKWVLSGSSDHTVRLWDVQAGKEIRRFSGHSSWVNAIGFSPRALQVVTGSGGEVVDGKFGHGSDVTVRIWDLQSDQELCRFAGHEASVTAVAFLPDGQHVLSAGLDRTVRLLRLPQ